MFLIICCPNSGQMDDLGPRKKQIRRSFAYLKYLPTNQSREGNMKYGEHN
jgi:hypothetical protein